MARQVLFFIVSIVLLTSTSVSCGETCNWTSHDRVARNPVDHETRLLDGWINAANGFVHTVSPNNLDTLEKVVGLVKEKQDVNYYKDVILEVLRLEAAFAACLFLGLIYFLTMGTGWSCFLCCRCCGNCGANKTQRQTKNINNRRCIYVVLTIGVLGFLTAAVTSAFLANEELHKVMKGGSGSVQKVIDKVELYINNTQKEITTLDDCVEETKDNTISSASEEEIKDKVAEPLTNKIHNESASVIQSLEKLNADFIEVKNLKKKIASVKKKEIRVGVLEDMIKELKNTCTSPSDKECTDTILPLKPDDFKELAHNSFNMIPSKVDILLDLDFLQAFLKQLNKMPEEIVRRTKQSREDFIKEVKLFAQDKTVVNGIEKSFNEFHDETKHFQKQFNNYYSEYITDHGVSRYWGVFGLIMLVAIPSGLLFLGLCCGLLGSKSGRYPSERSGLSHCGGCTLMASVYLMFIFGSLAMLVTVAFFQVGGHVEAYGCRYLYEKDLANVDRVLRLFLPNSSNSKVLEELKSLGIGETVSKCETDAALYEAIPSIESMLHVNLTFIAEIDYTNFDGYEKDVNVMVTQALIQLTNDIEEIVLKLDIPALQNLLGLSKNQIIKADITATVEALKPLSSGSDAERNRLLNALLQILGDMKKAAKKRAEITATLESTGNGEGIDKYKILVDKAIIDIRGKVAVIAQKIPATAELMVKEYCDEILRSVKDFANETTEKIKTKVGKCGPLYDAFTIGRHFACRDIMGPLNALWFSLGMCCFFFLFAIPFATKLSKHFYIMDEDEDSYIGMDSLHGQHMYINGYHGDHEVLHRVGNNNEKRPPTRPMHHQNGAYESDDVESRWTRY